MTFNEYQEQAITSDLLRSQKVSKATEPVFLEKAFGLVGEAGEVAEKVKKIIRDQQGELTADSKAELVKEVGDVLWYVSAMSHYLEVPLEDLAQANLEKVLSRKARGTNGGSGDNR